MQLSLDKSGSVLIRNYSAGVLTVGDDQHTSPVILSPDTVVTGWQAPAVDEMSIADFADALALQPELILFGSGTRQRFPPLSLVSGVMQTGVGFEAMDTGAASRTFNVLVGEGRRVVAALLLD
jgi:uncharacterized protein